MRGAVVEVARGLVGQEEEGLTGERTGDGHPLLLSTGQLVNRGAGLRGQPHLREQPLRTGPDLFPGSTRHREGEGHVLHRGAVQKQPEVLEDVADTAAKLPHFAVGGALRRESAYPDLSPGRSLHHVDEPQRGGFARARMAREEGELSLGQVEGDVFEGRLWPGVLFRDLNELDHAVVATP